MAYHDLTPDATLRMQRQRRRLITRDFSLVTGSYGCSTSAPCSFSFCSRSLSSLLTPNFLKPSNLSNILAQIAVIAIVAIGQHLVILTRGIDLSVGANLALATVIGGLVFRVTDSAAAVMLAMLLSGMVVGAVNGLVYVFGRLPHPFIITLATLSICRGLALRTLHRPHHHARHAGRQSRPSAGRRFFGVPNSFFVVAAALCSWRVFMAKYMVWGRWLYAVGGDPQAARGMGIPVKGVLVSAYVISGLCAGIGAILLAGRTGAVRRSTATCSNSTPSPPSSSAARAFSAAAATSAMRWSAR